MGLDWWSRDPFFSGRPPEDANGELQALRERVAELEQLVRSAGLDRGDDRRELPTDRKRS